MAQSSTALRVFKTLAGLAVLISLVWAVTVVLALPKLIGASRRDWMTIVSFVFLPYLLFMPALSGLYFGWQGIRKTDTSTIKRLLAWYCCVLAFVLATILTHGGYDQELNSFPPTREEDMATAWVNAAALISIFVLLGIYILASRALLRLLGHACPPIRQSVPAWPIGVVVFLLWAELLTLVAIAFPARTGQDLQRIVFSIFVTLPVIAAFKFVIRRATGQKVAETTEDSADP
ncbi:MAG: hypothetical protein RBU21_06760 [FCB group bacterium]|jgi:hypothetical protein|nr:hypothetical protein [FCB group bacterium]